MIATGRNIDVLQSLGADATIILGEDEASLEQTLGEHFATGVDIVLDFLWGPSARALLVAGAKAGREGVPIRFVQIGSASAPEVQMPAVALRSSAIEMMGSGLGSVSIDRLLAAIGNVFHAAVIAGLNLPIRTVPLAEVERAWSEPDTHARTVFAIG